MIVGRIQVIADCWPETLSFLLAVGRSSPSLSSLKHGLFHREAHNLTTCFIPSRELRRTRETASKSEVTVFCNPLVLYNPEETSHHLCYILFIKKQVKFNQVLLKKKKKQVSGSRHPKGEGIVQDVNTRRGGVIGDHLRICLPQHSRLFSFFSSKMVF